MDWFAAWVVLLFGFCWHHAHVTCSQHAGVCVPLAMPQAPVPAAWYATQQQQLSEQSRSRSVAQQLCVTVMAGHQLVQQQRSIRSQWAVHGTSLLSAPRSLGAALGRISNISDAGVQAVLAILCAWCGCC